MVGHIGFINIVYRCLQFGWDSNKVCQRRKSSNISIDLHSAVVKREIFRVKDSLEACNFQTTPPNLDVYIMCLPVKFASQKLRFSRHPFKGKCRGKCHRIRGYSGRITNSWGWIKMVRSLWKQNFTAPWALLKKQAQTTRSKQIKSHERIKTIWLVDQNKHPQMGCFKTNGLSNLHKQDTIIYIYIITLYVMSYVGFRGLMLPFVPFVTKTSCYHEVKIDSSDARSM